MEQVLANKILKWTLVCLVGVIVTLVVVGAVQKSSYEDQRIELQNQIASKDKTIEIKDGLFTVLTQQNEDLMSKLNGKDAEIANLKAELKKKDEELLAVTGLVIKWKKAYEDEAKAHQSIDPTTPGRDKVDFEKDFGYIGVSGYTLTNPAYAWVRVEQKRPLKLTVAVSQDESKAWHTYVTSSEENMEVNIELSAVNPYILQPKWYEGIGVTAMLGGGQSGSGIGGLAGIGLAYKIGNFDVGPSFIVTASDRVDKYFALTLNWHPFQR